MKHLESDWRNIEFLKSHDADKKYFKDYLGNNIILYNHFLECGFVDFHSYHSVVAHEKYLRNDGRMYVFRNGRNYYVEVFNEIMLHHVKNLFESNSFLQIDALTLECFYINSNIITMLSKIV